MRLGATLWIIVAAGVFGSVVVRAQNLDCVNDSVCYEWVKRYDGGADAVDRAIGAVTNRDGSRLYVTGISTSAAGGPDFATVAYNAATGEQLWVARYDSPAHRDDEPFAFGTGNVIAITPDSSMLFVTGYTTETNGKTDYLTIAYHTADGSEAWAAQYSTPDASIGTSLALSADGKRLYATGFSSLGPAQPPAPPAPNYDYGTVAYNAATGEKLWEARYEGPAGFWDIPYGIGVAIVPQPDGTKRETVFVTGRSNGASADNSDADYATVAYDSLTGEQLWISRYDGPGHDRDLAYVLTVNHDGSLVFITGESAGTGGAVADYATICYDAVTGQQRWVQRYDNGDIDLGLGLAVSPAGDRLAVTGFSVNQAAVVVTQRSIATIVYDVATGEQVWLDRHSEPDGAAATAITYSRDGRRLYAAGLENGNVLGAGFGSVGGVTPPINKQIGLGTAVIVAYEPETGLEVWASHYVGASADEDDSAIAVSPDGSHVFVAGGGQAKDADFATLSYPGLPPLPVELKITSFRRLETGHMLVEGSGPPRQSMTIEASNDLTGSFRFLATVTPGSDGMFQFEDTDTSDLFSRFYRAVWP